MYNYNSVSLLHTFLGLKTHDIVSFINQVNQQAERILTYFKEFPDESQIPQVTVRWCIYRCIIIMH